MAPATVMLVHGTWHAGACFDLVVPGLRAAGVPVVVPDLPSVGGAVPDPGATFGDFADDVAFVRAALDGHPDGSVVLLGHSRGGMVISEAGDHPAVARLVYLAGYMAEPGEDVSDLLVDGPDNLVLRGTRPEPDGHHSHFDPDLAEATFYHDCTPDRVAWALERLRRQRASFPAAPGPVCAWRVRPTTYCVCSEDRTISPAVQRRWAARVERSVEWTTSHSPFASRPELVVDLLVELAGGPGAPAAAVVEGATTPTT
jgi:pimeloyl-ACP methyl ester carboxylesterase